MAHPIIACQIDTLAIHMLPFPLSLSDLLETQISVWVNLSGQGKVGVGVKIYNNSQEKKGAFVFGGFFLIDFDLLVDLGYKGTS